MNKPTREAMSEALIYSGMSAVLHHIIKKAEKERLPRRKIIELLRLYAEVSTEGRDKAKRKMDDPFWILGLVNKEHEHA